MTYLKRLILAFMMLFAFTYANAEIKTFNMVFVPASEKGDESDYTNLIKIVENLTGFEINTIKSIFIGSILGLVSVYFVRFYSLACNGIKSGYLKINYSIDESSYLLGYSKFKTFSNIHIPYLKNSILLIGILIAIEIIKELPITLIMRPFNFETFATTAYIFASQDLLEAAAAPSLFLIIIASIFILVTSRYILKD